MTKTKKAAKAAKPKHEGANSGGDNAVRERRALSLKSFLPSDEIRKALIAKGKGHKEIVARVWGIATGIEEKVQTLNTGETVTSLAITGVLSARLSGSAQKQETSLVYLNNGFASAIAKQLETVRAIELDCDIVLEATGVNPPVAWIVTNRIEASKADTLHRLEKSRA